MSKKGDVGKILAGVAVGAGLGVLLAPKKGSDTRRELKEKINELVNKVKNIDKKEVKENINKKIAEIEEALTDLDKEKALKLAQEKCEKIKKKASDLVKYAKEKGTPALNKATESVREKAIEVTKEVLKKLEKSNS